MRLFSETNTPSSFNPNKSLPRLALQMHKLTLNTATSARHLLYAVRDIVCGHRDVLLNEGILHRDLGFNNLLLDSDSMSGVLIDFDITVNQGTTGDFRTGNRAFQSVKVLLRSERLGPHDHMDDLESLFYVLFYVCYGHDVDGRLLENLPEDLKLWTDPFSRPVKLGYHKKGFLLTHPIIPHVTRFVGKERKVVKRLMNNLRIFFEERLDSIVVALAPDQSDDSESDESDTSNPPKTFRHPDVNAPEDYSRFLCLVSTAIEELEKLAVAPVLLPPPPIPVASQGSTSSKRCRPLEEDPATPSAKRWESDSSAAMHMV